MREAISMQFSSTLWRRASQERSGQRQGHLKLPQRGRRRTALRTALRAAPGRCMGALAPRVSLWASSMYR
jgi:hypothetical protein